MNSSQNKQIETASIVSSSSLKIFGVGGAGGEAVEQMARSELSKVSYIALNTDVHALEKLEKAQTIQIGAEITRGLGAGGDPEVGRKVAEANEDLLKELCKDTRMIFIAAGLGGGVSSGMCPVLARIAAEAGALVMGIVTLPFDCEGERRKRQAQFALQQLKASADGVICLPNERILKHIDDKTGVRNAFEFANTLLAQAVNGIWELLNRQGIISVDFADICSVLRGRHAESMFAFAVGRGENRSRDLIKRLWACPLLEEGQSLKESDAILVSILGGPDLSMKEVNRITEKIHQHCGHTHIILGAAVDPDKKDSILVTLIASRRSSLTDTTQSHASGSNSDRNLNVKTSEEPDFDAQFLHEKPTPRPQSRFVAPAPELSHEKKAEMLAKQLGKPERKSRKAPRFKQGILPLEIVSKERFRKCQPTNYRGEDLDVPTYIRRGVTLN
jgi:cell division protein FtsZ